ncbi:MAG: hypothetical protein GIX03_05710 [Candidatus Eremiobacteraeota bacterium]|nr:hypothetical protein [Candidatus Eremiobacteraeota bacterium]MBC5802494.1 hypothetical protein [Candidatus Eremiobacteraeota bacterium]MBC5821596.1 hypothetical protein [Candidatus Eremiobacteraeota bacterium]
MNASIAVGVDAGGTSTVAALSRDGAYVAEARGGAANASTLGAEAAVESIVATVSQLTEQPGSLFVAAAGAARPDTREAVRSGLARRFPGARLAVEDDTRVALRAGHAAGPGIVLIAGTGSVAYAENGERRIRIGGAGYLLGDEGSAFWIGLAAVRLLERAFAGRAAADETTASVAVALDAPDRDALLSAVYRRPFDVTRVAALAPNIIELAGTGNRSASKIVQSAAQELGDLVRSAGRTSGLLEHSPTIVLGGGLLRDNTLLSYLLENRVASEIPGAAIVRLREEPARAALRFAHALAAGADPGTVGAS